MVNLYILADEIENVLNNLEIDEETGEILNYQALENLRVDFEEKAENVACYIKNLSSESKAMKLEEKNLAARRKAVENLAERLINYLKNNMVKMKKDKIVSPRVAVSFRKSV